MCKTGGKSEAAGCSIASITSRSPTRLIIFPYQLENTLTSTVVVPRDDRQYTVRDYSDDLALAPMRLGEPRDAGLVARGPLLHHSARTKHCCRVDR